MWRVLVRIGEPGAGEPGAGPGEDDALLLALETSRVQQTGGHGQVSAAEAGGSGAAAGPGGSGSHAQEPGEGSQPDTGSGKGKQRAAPRVTREQAAIRQQAEAIRQARAPAAGRGARGAGRGGWAPRVPTARGGATAPGTAPARASPPAVVHEQVRSEVVLPLPIDVHMPCSGLRCNKCLSLSLRTCSRHTSHATCTWLVHCRLA